MSVLGSRGQASIEYLVLFIAVLLVSSITAGALYTTTDILRIQADETSQSTSENINNNIEIMYSFGDVENREIKQLRLIVNSKRGSGDIDLSDSTIIYDSSIETRILRISNDATARSDTRTLTAASGQFDIDKKSSHGVHNPLIQDTKERYEILIPLGETVTTGEDASTTDVLDGTDDPYIVDITPFNVKEVKEVDGADIDDFAVINNNLIYEGEEKDNVHIRYTYFKDSRDSISTLNEGDNVDITIQLRTGSKVTESIRIPYSLNRYDNSGIKL